MTPQEKKQLRAYAVILQNAKKNLPYTQTPWLSSAILATCVEESYTINQIKKKLPDIAHRSRLITVINSLANKKLLTRTPATSHRTHPYQYTTSKKGLEILNSILNTKIEYKQ